MSALQQVMNITVWLKHSCQLEMRGHVTKKSPQESGGALMGYWGNPTEVVISNVIGPGPKAKHGLYSFTPDSEWQEEQIASIYEQSGRTVTYLGDWHSHPDGDGELSVKDQKTLKRVANYKPARVAQPLMLILHGELLLDMNFWCLTKNRWWGWSEVINIGSAKIYNE